MLFLLFSALPLGVFADNTTDITAEVDHPHTMTILPHPHGTLAYIAPDVLHEGDKVSFSPTPDEGYVLKSLGWYTTDPASVTDITESKILTMPDADVTIAAEFALLCNVTFDMQGHGTQVQGYTGVVAGSLIDAPVSPTASGYVFGGWYKQSGLTTAWNFEADAVTDHTTLYAKWIEDSDPSASVSGKVTEGGVNVPGATVELFLGTVKVAATVTDDNGNYSFKEVENGSYNIVVTKDDGKTKTEMVTIKETGSVSVNVELPVSAVNSEVEHSGNVISGARSDANRSVVGGLDAIAAKQTPGDGERITIKLTVNPKQYTGTDEQDAIKNAAGNGKNVEFLDMSLWKQVNDGDPANIGDINDTLLTIVIPFDFTKVEVSSIMILRNHCGKTTKLTATPNEYGEYFVVDASAGIITLYAMKFSEYAIAYDMVHEHEWETDFTVDSKPTCTQNGSKSIHCKTCTEVKEVTSIPATGHSFGEWQTVTAPTCEGKGSEKRVCSVCKFTETRDVDPTGHEWESDFTVDKKPTCTQEGSQSIHCKHCSATKDAASITATGHSFGEWITVTSVTCSGSGSEKRVCSVCGYTETRNLDPTGHEWESDFTVDKEPTCTEDGSKSIHCKHCDAVKDSAVISAVGHSFGEWQTVTSPTCEGKGLEKHVCTVCGHEETREIAPTGHEWESDFTVDKEPTCKEDGSKSIHCKHCDAVKDSAVIPHTEHKWADETVVKEATKTEDGEKTYTCEKCGEIKHVLIPKTGDTHKCIVHWFMIALLVLFVILFAVFALLKKKLLAFIVCGICGASTIVLAFFGGCVVCTVFTVVNLVVIAAGALLTVLRKSASDDDDKNNDKAETEQKE